MRSRQVQVAGISLRLLEAGEADRPVLFFLHGWPESVSAFDAVMYALREDAHMFAIDLPGIGGSNGVPSANDKRSLAGCVWAAIAELGLNDVTLVGHDIGGMIVYAYLHAHPGELRKAAILNTAIPGVDPWSEVVRNPKIWHFAFHAVPDLPEKLVAGREAAYFDFFYDALSAEPAGVAREVRAAYAEAYARPEALHTGFEWYRAFPQDERDNLAAKGRAVETPVLYVRGECEPGDPDAYLRGLRNGGLRNAELGIVPGCGHFSMNEKPDRVAGLLKRFLNG